MAENNGTDGDLYRANLPHFCCGFLVMCGTGALAGVSVIVDAAPIMR